jgi:hypothetical protein
MRCFHHHEWLTRRGTVKAHISTARLRLRDVLHRSPARCAEFGATEVGELSIQQHDRFGTRFFAGHVHHTDGRRWLVGSSGAQVAGMGETATAANDAHVAVGFVEEEGWSHGPTIH